MFPSLSFWQEHSFNNTAFGNSNINLTEPIVLDTFYYPEIIVDEPYIKWTVYSDPEYQHVVGCTNDKFDSSSGNCDFSDSSNNGVTLQALLIDSPAVQSTRWDNLKYLYVGNPTSEGSNFAGTQGSYHYLAFYNGVNTTELGIGAVIPTSFVDTNVERATDYTYSVFAENAIGNGTNSDGADVLTNDFPAQVTGLIAERMTPTQIDLQWDELPDDSGVGFPSTGVNLTKYKIFRSENGGAFEVIGENLRQSPPAIFFNDTSANALFFYSYNIEACNELGCGNATSNFFIASPPNPPTNLNATAVFPDVLLEWNGNITDTSYRIERTGALGNLSIENLWLNFNFDDPDSRYNTNGLGGQGWRWGNDNRTQAGNFGGNCDLDVDCVRSKPIGSQDGVMSLNSNFGSVQFQNDAVRLAGAGGGAGMNGTGSDYDFFNSGDWSVNAWIHPEVNTASSPYTLMMLSTIDEIDNDFNDRNGIKIMIGPSGNNTDGNFDRFLVQALDDSIDDVFVMNETSPIGMYDNDSVFHMFTIVHKNGEYLKWYRDGVLLETDVGTPLLSGTSDFPVIMGNMWGTCYNFENITNSKCTSLRGATVQTHVDEWSVWKQAIGDSDISTLYGGGLGFNFTGNNVDGDDGSASFTIIDTISGEIGYDILSLVEVSGSGFNPPPFDSVTGQDTIPRDIFFSPNGTKFFMLGDDGNDVNEYTISGTAFDVSTRSFVQTFSVATQTTSPQGLFFKPDGSKMFIGTSGDIHEYTLSNPFDVSSATFSQTGDVSAGQVGKVVSGMFFSQDGTKLYTANGLEQNVTQFYLSVPWNTSTI